MCTDDRDDPEALLDRGVRAIAAGDIGKARRCYERALDLFREIGDEGAVDDVLAALRHLGNGDGS